MPDTLHRRLPCGCEARFGWGWVERTFRCAEALALFDAQGARLRRLYREITAADLEPERRLLRRHLHRRPGRAALAEGG